MLLGQGEYEFVTTKVAAHGYYVDGVAHHALVAVGGAHTRFEAYEAEARIGLNNVGGVDFNDGGEQAVGIAHAVVGAEGEACSMGIEAHRGVGGGIAQVAAVNITVQLQAVELVAVKHRWRAYKGDIGSQSSAECTAHHVE